ncbi:hypothetical protein DDB_G0284523 [Dictyostelium discoideum AX4]|uniref:Uncharacterized protein n=1 Tax=Dictyostelium discoideum TaxID=44689 RepID=Q54PI7_DICDI|nr:hypothetical protein DDB_G0284523 [Dictyostelium discoideum AX4]EAL65188.1 hypothetical protein DDB_G0284523 [Dictyostelium discoideum AX4]|eukprot:XP_638545.1 hypothetical protein DDB_G0284523 [Dictyostelium discoideum AX4]
MISSSPTSTCTYVNEKDKKQENELFQNPITSPFKVYLNNKGLFGTGNSICIGSNFYIISAAGQQVLLNNSLNKNIDSNINLNDHLKINNNTKSINSNKINKINDNDNNNNTNNDNFEGLNNLNKEMLISVGSSCEQIKVLKLFVIESVNIAVSYSIHNVPFVTNFINEIGKVRIKQIESTSYLYKEGEKIRKNGVGTGFTQGIIIKNLSHLFISKPDFANNGDCGSLVVNDDGFVLGVILSTNQNHTIIAKLELFSFLFK